MPKYLRLYNLVKSYRTRIIARSNRKILSYSNTNTTHILSGRRYCSISDKTFFKKGLYQFEIFYFGHGHLLEKFGPVCFALQQHEFETAELVFDIACQIKL